MFLYEGVPKNTEMSGDTAVKETTEKINVINE